MPHALRSLAVALALSGASLHAQDAPRVDPTELHLREGRRALEARDYAAAYGHFLRALEHAPDEVEILTLLLQASAGDADATALWRHELWARLADGRGRVRLSREQREAAHEGAADAEKINALRHLSPRWRRRQRRL